MPFFCSNTKRKFNAFKEWTKDRKARMRVYNDDFIREVPALPVTKMIMDDEFNLDTDDDRGYITPQVKKITELGGTPNFEIMSSAVWDQFIPPARTPPKKPIA